MSPPITRAQIDRNNLLRLHMLRPISLCSSGGREYLQIIYGPEHVGSQENGITLACRCILCGRRLRNNVRYPRLGVLMRPPATLLSFARYDPDYTSPTSHSIVLDYGQFFGRTFWRVRKLTLNLTKRRTHTPSIKTALMGLLTEWARSACRDADRGTHPTH